MSPLLNIVQEPSGCDHHVSLNLASNTEGTDPQKFMGRAAVVTLGCAKNQVDSEVMIGVLRHNGFEIVDQLDQADVAIVNTCGFLQSALKESINCIIEVAEYKQTGRLRKLVVAGCAVERYREELKSSLPEVDTFITLDDVLRVGDAALGKDALEFEALLKRAGRPYFIYDDSMPRQLSTKQHTAYVKIAEGCNRPCTFCIIPKIRGEMRSRELASIVREVKALGAQGVREVNLIAQDLTSYGADRKGPALVDLLRAIDETKALPWIRLLYAYPVGITDELLKAIVDLPSVVEYLDIPLQHVNLDVLTQMKRPLGRLSPRALVESIRSKAPSIQLRTTFIVGFPGETEEAVTELEGFIAEGHFASVGVFTYSPEPGTPSAEFDSQITDRAKTSRRNRLMRAQQKVVAKRLQGYIGKTIEVLVEGAHEETELLVTGRARFQAPEVDGVVIINDVITPAGAAEVDLGALPIGQIAQVEITGVAGYDLLGSLKL